MSDPAIVIEKLSKSYRIRHQADMFPTFRDALRRAATAPWRRLCQLSGRRNDRDPGLETFWALKDVSFEVETGEVTGIIGCNGAGKSTLLKIQSRITEPTAGRATLNGRVASLLEVGTGFHAELTGRENIYLNGAILGMKQAETRRKFDEIVAFSEVEKFLDTPVKFYSSGMYVRLAFAVAAHLEPDVLIVDEVLAVGDVAFQRKCLAKMQQFAQQSGRTVLFVSHNLASVRALCTRGIVLEAGRLVLSDSAEVAVGAYLRSLEEQVDSDLSKIPTRRGEGRIRLKALTISSGGYACTTMSAGQAVRFEFRITGVLPGMSCHFTIFDRLGQPLVCFDSTQLGPEDRQEDQPATIWVCEIDELLLTPGRYRINTAVYGGGVLQDHIEGAALIDVVPGTVRGRPAPSDSDYLRLLLPHRWVTPISDATACG